MELRGMGIGDVNVLAAIEKVPREMFVPQEMREHAYRNTAIPIGMEQTISQPYVVAFMTAALELTGREYVLEIGTGSGYQTAILSHLSRRVHTIERLRPLLVGARNLFRELRLTNITSNVGNGAAGWPEGARYDRIIATCATRRIPGAFLNQLKPGGILIAPEGEEHDQRLVLVRRTGDEFARKDVLPVRFVPMVDE